MGTITSYHTSRHLCPHKLVRVWDALKQRCSSSELHGSLSAICMRKLSFFFSSIIFTNSYICAIIMFFFLSIMEACQGFVCAKYHFFAYQLSSQTRIFVQLSFFFPYQLWKLVRDLYVQSIIFFLINYLHRLIYLCNHQFFFLTNYLHKLICLSLEAQRLHSFTLIPTGLKP